MIETPRFILRKLESGDAKYMFALNSDPELHHYLGNNPQTERGQSEQVISIV